ncbi:GTPase activating protein [Entomophthora muscae]|uniref:GTPase activating protein n=1 Tax=Entomophthora muscae TaxID=34485 RepID=A0ACC2T956_9FUNG|nr:GTPase activating protein [Entomophthora muscae]
MSGFSEIRWSVLEAFAKVTRACEDLQDTVISHPITQQILPYTSSNHRENEHRNRNFRSPNARSQTLSQFQGLDEITHLYLTRWAAGIVERASTEISLRFNLGLARQYGLPDLLSSGQSTPFSEGLIDTEVGAFEVWQDSSRGPSVEIICMSREPLTPVEWIGYYTRTDSVQDLAENKLHATIQMEPAQIYKRIFMGGIDPDLRPEIWKYLLGIYPWDSTEKERKELDARNSEKYMKLKQKWLDPEIRKSEDYIEQQFRIEKDVLRTDRHVALFATQSSEESGALPNSNEVLEQLKDILMCYHFYNQELGYVQGMSDLLSPLYSVFNDEVNTFWGFVSFMNRVKENFSRDQKGMHHQLQTISLLVKMITPTLHSHLVEIGADTMFSCFRWILIWYKREFSFENILFLWEVFWTNYHTKHFHLFVAVAILEIHQHVIVTHLRGLDEILKYTNDLSMSMDFRVVLRRAELMFLEFESTMKTQLAAEESPNAPGQPESIPAAASDDPNTPFIVTPPPEVHSYTVSPSSPPFGPTVSTLTPEEFSSLKFILEK